MGTHGLRALGKLSQLIQEVKSLCLHPVALFLAQATLLTSTFQISCIRTVEPTEFRCSRIWAYVSFLCSLYSTEMRAGVWLEEPLLEPICGISPLSLLAHNVGNFPEVT